MSSSWTSRVTVVVAAAAAAGLVLALPPAADRMHSAHSKSDEQLEELASEQKRLASKMRGLDARIIMLEELRSSIEASSERVLPSTAKWLALQDGASEQWDFPIGGRVQIKYHGLDDAGTATFEVNSRAAELTIALAPGTSMRAVDDLGEKRRIYDVTLHTQQQDRSGRPSAALLSVVVTEERL